MNEMMISDGWNELFDKTWWMKIAISLACGTILGLERQFRGKPVGIRTSILICLSTMSFVSIGNYVADEILSATRILGQIVTGVGFLGAGVILSREGLILGVTSASVIWLLAASGAAIGFEKYGIALSLCVVGISTLLGVEKLENTFSELRKGVHAPNLFKKFTRDSDS